MIEHVPRNRRSGVERRVAALRLDIPADDARQPRPVPMPPQADAGSALLLAVSPGRRGEQPASAAGCATDTPVVTDGGALERALESRPPRLLLIDVELCADLGVERLRRLRCLAHGTQWVLAWPVPSLRWLDVVRVTQARGAVCRDAAPAATMRALNAVLAGELWFPRSVLASLYISLLHAPASDETLQLDGSDAAHLLPLLTRRETQVLSLVREGLTNKQIARRLAISANTVKKHLASAFGKRGLKSRRQTLAGEE